MSLLLLVIFSTIAVSFAITTDMNVQKSNNTRSVQTAQLAAESGLEYFTYAFTQLSPDLLAGSDMMANIADEMSSLLDGTGNLSGYTIGYYEGSDMITIPEISLGAERGCFSGTITLDTADDNKIWVTVNGRTGQLQRMARMAFRLIRGQQRFEYAVATSGPISMSGQAHIASAGDPSEASMLSMYGDGATDAFDLSGQVTIDGDICVSDPNATLNIGSNVQVGGTSTVLAATLPEPDPTIFMGFADTPMGDHTPPVDTYTNIRIPPGTDPTFSSDTVLQGVIYIEHPNNVSFAGQVTIRGVIVTDDCRDSTESSSISFSGQVQSYGVETLPDIGPEGQDFTNLKELPGTFILAPGFDVSFSGQFGTLNGAVAAGSLTFNGQAGGTVRGVLLSYDHAGFECSGQAGLVLDRAGNARLPIGLGACGILEIQPSSYREY